MEATQIATALRRDDVVALGAFKSRVTLVGVGTPTRIAEFDTVLDFGGGRLALCTADDRLIVVAGAWAPHVLVGYDALTGRALWERRDLKRVGPLNTAGQGHLLAVTVDGRAMQVLDALTGRSVASIRGAHGLWQHPDAPIAVSGWYRRIAAVDTESWQPLWRATTEGFVILDAAFAADAVIASDAVGGGSGTSTPGGNVTVFDLEGREGWRYALEPDVVAWAVGWDVDAGQWIAVTHHVEGKASDMLLRWSLEGRLLSSRPIGEVGVVKVLHGGRRVVTATHVIDTRTGAAERLPPA